MRLSAFSSAILSGVMLLGTCTPGATDYVKPLNEPRDLTTLKLMRANQDGLSGDEKGALATNGNIRLKSIRQAGAQIGQQGGLAWRYAQINQELEMRGIQLEQIYNFNAVLIDKMVLPPVLLKTDQALRVSDDVARGSMLSYRIEYPARIISVPPTWRDFLIHNYPQPKDINPILLPRTAVERETWMTAVESGWKLGEAQAVGTYETNLNLLTRVFQGMIIYRKLLSEGIVSSPVLAKASMGITTEGGGRVLNVGDTIYRLTENGGFNNVEQWKVVPRTSVTNSLGDGSTVDSSTDMPAPAVTSAE